LGQKIEKQLNFEHEKKSAENMRFKNTNAFFFLLNLESHFPEAYTPFSCSISKDLKAKSFLNLWKQENQRAYTG
jgi:hypothetical protein